MIFKNKSSDFVLIFVHGFGTSDNDFFPLADSFHQSGYSCETILLKGHDNFGQEINNVSFNDWILQIQKVYDKYILKKKKIIMVGFSLGGALCLEFSKTNNVEGVLSISTFLGTTKIQKKLLKTIRALGIKQIPRNLQVTCKTTKKELNYFKSLPTKVSLMVSEKCNEIILTIDLIKCPILFIHSLDDKVASYKKVFDFFNRLETTKKNLITVNGLKHFIQFDIQQDALVKLSEAYFIESHILKDDPLQIEYAQKAWLEALTEEKHWSGILFKLITIYFTVFGTLVYFSLKVVLAQEPSAPYYLTSYSIVTSLFFVLLALYSSYLNRVLYLH